MMYVVIFRYELEDGRYSKIEDVSIKGTTLEAVESAKEWVGVDWIKTGLQNMSPHFIDEFSSARPVYHNDDTIYRVATVMNIPN